jgi:DNA-binding transcriptional LysR family regulator
MNRSSIDDLEALLSVVREGSFTRAAAKLGVTQSALSQTVRAFEALLGIKLLTRTTRSVAPTEAGERLLRDVGPRLEEIRDSLAAVTALGDRPSGTIRIAVDEYALEAYLWPALHHFLPRHPEINVETDIDYGLTDIVAERFDAGVRLGDVVTKDMIAVPISGDQRMLVVAAPEYLSDAGVPKNPQELTQHRCYTLRSQIEIA